MVVNSSLNNYLLKSGGSVSGNLLCDNIDSSVVGGTINIGNKSLVINLGLDNSVDAKTINIGSSGDSVNIYGNTTYV